MKTEKMKIEQNFAKVDNVNQNLLTRFLEPYKDDCKYLKKAQFQYPELESAGTWSIEGEFAIPDSCYIDDTGHFNAVEFNICYNQIYYVAISYLIQNRLVPSMQDWDLEAYKRRQLSDFLIVKFSSAFKRPVNGKKFQGTLKINKCSSRGDLIMMKTSCAFYDHNQGWAEGDVTIAILNGEAQKAVSQKRNAVYA